jgi:hypothetical protein
MHMVLHQGLLEVVYEDKGTRKELPFPHDEYRYVLYRLWEGQLLAGALEARCDLHAFA